MWGTDRASRTSRAWRRRSVWFTGNPPDDLAFDLLFRPLRMGPHDLGPHHLPGRLEGIRRQRDPLVRLHLAQDIRDRVVHDLNPPRVDGALHGVIVIDYESATDHYFAGTSRLDV